MRDTVGTSASGLFREATVSTVHIVDEAIDYEVFETMVFGARDEERRYENLEAALKGHKEMCTMIFSPESIRSKCKFCGNLMDKEKLKCSSCGAGY